MSRVEIQREYTYNRNGKDVKIKRKWTTNQDKLSKKQAVDKYFADNIDEIRQAKNIKKVYKDYNENNTDNNVSYNMIYTRYIKIFGPRYNHKIQQEEQTNE